MKISKKLPQFNNKKVLLIISGQLISDFYMVHNGIIKKIKKVQRKQPRYSDREGHFLVRGRGRLYGSGSVYEAKKNVTREKFKKDLARATINTVNKEKIDEIYFFAPKHLLPYFQEELPLRIKKLIKFDFRGNYTNKHPFKLLKKIKKRKLATKNKKGLLIKNLDRFKEVKKLLKRKKVGPK